MIKRLSWFVGGAVAGVAGVGIAKRKVKETAAQLAPANIARSAVDKVRHRGHDLVEAVRDGREAMHAKEAELRAKLDGTSSTLADELDPEDLVLVEGRPVEPGQVIVLRQVREDARDQHGKQDHAGPRRTSRRNRRGA